MALAELAIEAVGGALRVAGRIVVDIVFEVLIKGAGYAAIKVFRPRSEPDETWCALIGLMIFAAVVAAGLGVYHYGTH